LFTSDGLVFILKDFDKLGGNEKLGVVTVPAKTLYEANGERMEFKLQSPGYKSRDVSGYMAIRCRRASPSDIQFMEESRVPKSKHLDFLHKAVLEGKTGAGSLKAILSKRTRVVASGKNAGLKRVSRPHYPYIVSAFKKMLTMFGDSIKSDQGQIHFVQTRLRG
jgi:hypothetical protein